MQKTSPDTPLIKSTKVYIFQKDYLQEQSTIKPGRECGKPPCRDFLHRWELFYKSSYPSPSGTKGRSRQIEVISGQIFYL